MATQKNARKQSTGKAGEERMITSASGITVTKKGGNNRPKTVKRPGGKTKGGK